MEKYLKFVFLTMLIILSFMLKAHDNNIRVTENKRFEPLVIEAFDKSGNSLIKYVYEYDAAGNKTSELFQRFIDNNWVNIMRQKFIYDEFENLLSISRETYNNDSWNFINRIIQTFDINGNMLTQITENWSQDSWVPNTRLSQSFDNSGNMLGQLNERWIDKQWCNYSRNTWTFNEINNMSTRLIENWVNNMWISLGYTVFTYDGSGNLISEEQSKNGLNINRILYDYNESNKMSSRIQQNWSADQYINVSRNTWIYDVNGNVLTYIEEGWANEDWNGAQRETYTYDDLGNMITKITERKMSATWLFNMRYTCTYDVNGNKLSQLEERWMGSEWTNVTDNYWTYDASKNILTEMVKSWRQGDWIVTYEAERSYDENGNSIVIDAPVKDNRSIILYYNNSLSQWTCPEYNAAKIIASYINVSDIVTEVESVSLNESELHLEIGESFQLNAIINPYSASNKNVEWSSSDESIASVDDNGLVKAVSFGEVSISVKTVDGGFTADCVVNVLETVISVTGITLNAKDLEMNIGSTFMFRPVIIPMNATNQNVIWEVSDNYIVSIDSDGLLTALSEGYSKVTVKTVDGGFVAESNVNIVSQSNIPVVSVSLNESVVNVIPNSTLQLIAGINPSNATNKGLTWETSNESIAVVSKGGLVTAVAAGTVIITVKTIDGGCTAMCKIIVNDNMIAVTSVALNETKVFLELGSTFQLIPLINPMNATNQKVSWESSNNDVVTIDENGLVMADGSGVAIVTVTTEDGGCTALCKIEVGTTGINEYEENYLKVFYALNSIVIESSKDIMHVTVSDLNGKIVYKSDNSDVIYTSSWNKGLYLIRVVNKENEVVTNKILIY